MHDDAQYYTPQRVRYWLDRYPELCIAVQYGCALDASEVDPGQPAGMSKPMLRRDLASRLLVIKCDLERAIRALDDRERKVILLQYRDQLTTREIGAMLRVSHQRISEISRDGVAKMAARLGYTQ